MRSGLRRGGNVLPSLRSGLDPAYACISSDVRFTPKSGHSTKQRSRLCSLTSTSSASPTRCSSGCLPQPACGPANPFEIEGENIEKGVRYVVVGTKTKQSKRRVPLPASLLPHLPGKIRSALFTEDQNKVLPRLNKWLRDLGIDGECKCV